MRVCVLFSGGKDSCLSLLKAKEQGNEIACLLNVRSENPYSYMFHTINSEWTRLQSKALGIPLEEVRTKGEKEKELLDLENGLSIVKEKYKIEGVVSGAIASSYQYDRILKICERLNLKSITPLWRKPQVEILKSVLENKMRVMIVGVSSYPLNEEFLGRVIDERVIEELERLSEKLKLNVSGEGGEFETFVLDMPLFKKRIKIVEFEKHYKEYVGYYKIKKAVLVSK